MQRVKAKAPEKFKAHVIDTEKRLNILFDHLNNDDVRPDTVQQLNELANNIQARQYDQAGVIFSDIMTNKTDEGSDWIVSSTLENNIHTCLQLFRSVSRGCCSLASLHRSRCDDIDMSYGLGLGLSMRAQCTT